MILQQENNTINSPVYPSINLYSSPRVLNQRVNNAKLPLLKYREQIKVHNCSRNNDADTI